jgi:hypothetical protein
MIDFGSRNGTFLNGKRLSVAKQESDPHEVIHGSLLQVGGTKLLCHIHAGQETCGHCEPGLVQQANVTPGKQASCIILLCCGHVDQVAWKSGCNENSYQYEQLML